MLNESKIKIMTYLAKEEQKNKGEDFRIMDYYKYDYIRYHLIKNFLSVSVGYVIVLGLVALYKSEYLIANAILLDYKSIAVAAVGIYLLVLIGYSVMTALICSARYDKCKAHVGKYYKLLELLRKFYDNELEQK